MKDMCSISLKAIDKKQLYKNTEVNISAFFSCNTYN